MSKGKFAVGAIFGAAVGVITGVLTAKKSGKETRSELKIKADKAQANVDKKIADAKIEANTLRKRTERAVEGAKKGFLSKK